MRRCLLSVVLLLALGTVPARGNGWLFRRSAGPTEVRYSYYVPGPVFWVPVAQPVALPVFVPPVVSLPVVSLPPVTNVPMNIPMNVPMAVPSPAPPSAVPDLPAPPPGTSALKQGTPYYDLYSGPTPLATPPASGRCSVAFWNLTGRALTLRVAGQERMLPPGRSLTLELPREFGWNVVGREAEAARIPTGHTTAEILIRR
ncbi:MAG TPA: hypothetical protein VKD72_17690 [Gemmataceae bacterium]|nr:hypothetical protein [Gemmataceae bacterium]